MHCRLAPVQLFVAFGSLLALSLAAPLTARAAAPCMLPSQLRLRQILVDDRAKAVAVETKLKAGADFRATLRANALMPQDVATGGEIGWVWLDELDASAAQQLAALPVGGISAPIREIGYAVMQVEARRPPISCAAAVKLAPNDPRPHYQLGLVALQANDTTTALAELNAAIRLAPRNEPALLARAVVDMRRKDRIQAQSDLDAAIAANGSDPNAYVARGYYETLVGKDDLATTDETKALQFQPNDPVALLYRSNAYFDLGYLHASADDLALPLRNPATMPRAQLQRGLNALAAGDDATALDALALAAQNPPLANIASLTEGAVRIATGNAAAAIGDLARAHAADPSDPYAMLWLTYARRSLGQPDDLTEQSRVLDLARWPGPVVRLFLGTASERDVLGAAINSDPYTARVQQCEATFYIALDRKLRHRDVDAANMLREAATSCPYRAVERWIARAMQ